MYNRITMSLADQINELNSLEGLSPWERLVKLTSEPNEPEPEVPEHDHDENCDCNPNKILFDADLRGKLLKAGDRYLATVTVNDLLNV